MRQVDVSHYMSLPYSRVVSLEVDDEGDRFYTATHPELLGCRGQGATPEEAVADLLEAKELYLAALLDANVTPPDPTVLRSERLITPRVQQLPDLGHPGAVASMHLVPEAEAVAA